MVFTENFPANISALIAAITFQNKIFYSRENVEKFGGCGKNLHLSSLTGSLNI